MFNGMMDPELMRLAQEQMSRIPPQEFARIQQQMMSNPQLFRLASESMKNMRPEDLKLAAEQLKHTRPEDIVEIGEKVANAKPEEIAAMKAHADAQVSYELSATQMLKQEGNKLHSNGKYHAAANKYLLAKRNLKDVPSSKGGTLLLQCSLNLMSCYLKLKQFEDCITEGSEVLAYDSKNVKALYRRGQAYKELGNLEAAVSDLRRAHEFCPEDETIAEVFREASEKCMEAGDQHVSKFIEEIQEAEDINPIPSESNNTSSLNYSVSEPTESGECSRSDGPSSGASSADSECLNCLRGNPEALRSFQTYLSSASPETLATMGAGGMSPELVKTASDMLKSMKPEELQKMHEVASSLNGKLPVLNIANHETVGAGAGGVPPEMVKTARDMISKMKPEELQKMHVVSSSLDGEVPLNINGDRSNLGSQVPDMMPEMMRMASDKMSRMTPEELQKMLDIASSMNISSARPQNGSMLGSKLPEMSSEMVKLASETMSKMSPEECETIFEVASSINVGGIPSSSSTSDDRARRSECSLQSSTAAESSSRGSFSSSGSSQASPSFPTSNADVLESLRNSMKDPAMKEMFTSMMKNISPEIMANMSEQYGMKLSKEDAGKVQQAMSSLSPEDLDKMMRWADRAQRCIENVKKIKNWLLGRPGLILAIFMLFLAFFFHRLGFIGG